jgi:hypothetical protein
VYQSELDVATLEQKSEQGPTDALIVEAGCAQEIDSGCTQRDRQHRGAAEQIEHWTALGV